jgi:Fe-S-cluster containining protein
VKFKRCHGETHAWLRARRAYDRLDKRVEERKRAYLEEHKRALPCKSGCFQCCRAQVLAVEAEGFAFADYLQRRLSEDQLKELKARFEVWYATLVENQLDVEVLAPRQYHAVRAWCPILDRTTGACSQYEMRPVVCRTHHSLDAEDCEVWETTPEGLAALYTDDLMERPVTEIGYGHMPTVSYWQFWVGKHLGCDFADKAPPLFAEEEPS